MKQNIWWENPLRAFCPLSSAIRAMDYKMVYRTDKTAIFCFQLLGKLPSQPFLSVFKAYNL